MLTKDDLKQIGNVVDERPDEKLEPIKKVFNNIEKGRILSPKNYKYNSQKL